jgi:hypothetical protein
MALTTEQQAQVDIALAINAGERVTQTTLFAKQARLEATRLAQQTLIENARSKPAGEREITAADIIAFADTLTASVNA